MFGLVGPLTMIRISNPLRLAVRLVGVRQLSTKPEFFSHAHIRGSSDLPLSNHTLGSLLDSVCRDHGSKPAVVSLHQDTQITYNELNQLSNNLASNLSSIVKKGDKVAVCCGNRWEYLVIQMGLGKLGAVLVPLNTAFTDEQFEAALQHCQATVLISQRQLQKRQGRTRDLNNLVNTKLLKHVFVIGEDFGNLLQSTSISGMISEQQPDDVINMQFTSGTTSAPKLSSLTHRNIVNNGIFIGNRMGLTAVNSAHPTGQDHLCIPVPMFHCFGLVLANLASVSHGCALVYPSETFDVNKSLEAVRKYNCTGLYGVPTMFAQQLESEELKKGGMQYLSKGIAAGSSIPIEMMNRLINQLNLTDLTICYGMTETSPVSFMTSPDDPLSKRTETVGKIMPHTEAMIVDPAKDDLEPVPVDTKGEILVSGYLLQKEYHQDPKATSESMITDLTGKRWMRTGDEGVIDAEGYLTVTGRIKDLIIRGGENIHPLEIENALFTHPKVSQASVVGAPCDKYGETIVAFIIPHANAEIDAQELQQYVKDKIGPFMAPEHVLFVDDFPKTASGKIRKVELRDMAQQLI